MTNKFALENVDDPFFKQLGKQYGNQTYMGEKLNRLNKTLLTRLANLNRKKVGNKLGVDIPLRNYNDYGRKKDSSIIKVLKRTNPDIELLPTNKRYLTRGKIKRNKTLNDYLSELEPTTGMPRFKTMTNQDLALDPRFKSFYGGKLTGKSGLKVLEDRIQEFRKKNDLELVINKFGREKGKGGKRISLEPLRGTRMHEIKRLFNKRNYKPGDAREKRALDTVKRTEVVMNAVLDNLSPDQRKIALGMLEKEKPFMQALHTAAVRSGDTPERLYRPEAMSTWYRNLMHFHSENAIKALLKNKTKSKAEIDIEIKGWADDMRSLGLQSEIDGKIYGAYYDQSKGMVKPLVQDLQKEYPLKMMNFRGQKFKPKGSKDGGLIDTNLDDTSTIVDDLPLLDPQESIERHRMAAGGVFNLYKTLSKVPKAVGSYIKQSKGTPSSASDISVTQAAEDKPAMFLETVRVLEEAPDAKLTPNEWLSYVKQKGVGNVELDEFGLEPLLNNMMKSQKGSASFKKSEDNLKVVQEEGQNITRNFSDLMNTHRGDKTHPDVIAATEALQSHKLKVKQASDILAKLKSEQRAATPLLSKTELLETYNKEMPQIDMDISMAEPVSRGANDIVQMLTKTRPKTNNSNVEPANVFSNDARLFNELQQPPQDVTGMKVREMLLNNMQNLQVSNPAADPINSSIIKFLKKNYQGVEMHKGVEFKEMWETGFPKMFHGTNDIVKKDHFEVLKNLVPQEDIAQLAKSKNIPEEKAFEQLYQALNIFDRNVMTADVPIPFWTKKLLYRMGDMSEGRGFFYKSKKNPSHEGTQFIPGGSGYGELKFYHNFKDGSVRAAESKYNSGHFGGEGFKGEGGNSPFGWLRFSERTDESGRKLLLVEETQSDLHQNVAQKGYRYAPRLDKGNVMTEMSDFAAQLVKKEDTLASTRLRKDNLLQLPREERNLPENVAELKNVEKAMSKLVGDIKSLKVKVQKQNAETGKSGSVHPDVPFKKSENYAKVFMQGLMKMADDQGYDGIGLSTGKMKKQYGGIPKGGDKFYDEIGVKAMKRIAKKSGFKFGDTTIMDGNGFTWEKIPIISMRDINTGKKFAGESTIPVYNRGGQVNKRQGYNGY